MPRPIAVLSSNTNPDYLSLLPIVAKSWDMQQFNCWITINLEDETKSEKDPEFMRQLAVIRKYMPAEQASIEIVNKKVVSEKNPALYTQCARLYAPKQLRDLFGNTYIIMSDADMFMCSSFIVRDFDKVNVFGHDLTGFGHVPICYVGMYADKWKQLMDYDNMGMERDLATFAKKDSTDWLTAWCSDQDIITAKLKNFGFGNIHFINRGQDPKNSSLPMGRWDRYNWQKPTSEIHDAHLMRQPLSDENFPKIVELCKTVYPNQDWGWLNAYRNDFLNFPDPQVDLDRFAVIDEFDFLKDVQNWSNHRPLMWLALNLTDEHGTVLELGCGHGSTPYLHKYCLQRHRKLITFDTNQEWLSEYLFMRSETHELVYRPDNHETDYFLQQVTTENKISVCLVDHAKGERRHSDIMAIADKVEIFIIHDTEPVGAGNYMYDKIWHLFKYRINIKSAGAWASIVSNVYDVTKYNGYHLGDFKLEV